MQALKIWFHGKRHCIGGELKAPFSVKNKPRSILRDYRDLIIARSVPPDGVCRLTKTEERVVRPRPGSFRQADSPSMRAKLDSSLARRG